MKLICPSCGAVAGADAWENDAKARELLQAVCGLPGGLPGVVLGYLSLFRPGKSALSWKKALRLTQDLAGLANAGSVQVQGKVARPCPVRLWVQGIEQMVERRASLQLPLPNHNYLRQIVWSLADTEDRKLESEGRKRELDSSHHLEQRGGEAEMSEVMRRFIERHGDPDQGNECSND